MGRPPSKIHDPIGYDRYYSNSGIGYVLFFVLIFFLIKGCGG
jgi:hypothetical protein